MDDWRSRMKRPTAVCLVAMSKPSSVTDPLTAISERFHHVLEIRALTAAASASLAGTTMKSGIVKISSRMVSIGYYAETFFFECVIATRPSQNGISAGLTIVVGAAGAGLIYRKRADHISFHIPDYSH